MHMHIYIHIYLPRVRVSARLPRVRRRAVPPMRHLHVQATSGPHACTPCTTPFRSAPGSPACACGPGHTLNLHFNASAPRASCRLLASRKNSTTGAGGSTCSANASSANTSSANASSTNASSANASSAHAGCASEPSAPAAGECITCASNTYKLFFANSACSACPAHTKSQARANDVSACLCAAHYSGPPDGPCAVCTVCFYCPGYSAGGAPLACKAGATSAVGVVAASACVCTPGKWNGPSGLCHPCPRGQYCPDDNLMYECPSNSTARAHSGHEANCTCDSGFVH